MEIIALLILFLCFSLIKFVLQSLDKKETENKKSKNSAKGYSDRTYNYPPPYRQTEEEGLDETRDEYYYKYENLVNSVKKEYEKKKDTQSRRYISKSVREEVLRRDGYRCQICGISKSYLDSLCPGLGTYLLFEIDHVVPVANGGGNCPENLQTLCWKCNRKKSNTKTNTDVLCEMDYGFGRLYPEHGRPFLYPSPSCTRYTVKHLRMFLDTYDFGKSFSEIIKGFNIAVSLGKTDENFCKSLFSQITGFDDDSIRALLKLSSFIYVKDDEVSDEFINPKLVVVDDFTVRHVRVLVVNYNTIFN